MTESTNSFVIHTQGLSKSFNKFHALKSLDLSVPKHSIFGFLGPNGAGKTTTIKMLLGLAKPTQGSGKLFGLDIVQDSVEIRKRVGYLAQDPRFYGRMTARETLHHTARYFYSGPQAAIESRINETLELVGLENKADRSITGFSGGERQRLGIAQAQINHPDLLILDEPAAALDPRGRRDVLAIMERLRKYATIFYSTHILDDVQRVSDAVAILNHGELVAQDSIEALLAGGDGVVYQVTVKGDTAPAHARLVNQGWVTGVKETAVSANSMQAVSNQSTWQISVSDEAAAETNLLRLLVCDEQCTVTEFGRRKYELEEIFLNIVEGGDDE